jgi:hypothetical protein
VITPLIAALVISSESGQRFHGPEKVAWIQDFAAGLTAEQMAVKWDRSHQNMKEFSARNVAQIRQAREQQNEELSAELRGVWIADRASRIKWL